MTPYNSDLVAGTIQQLQTPSRCQVPPHDRPSQLRKQAQRCQPLCSRLTLTRLLAGPMVSLETDPALIILPYCKQVVTLQCSTWRLGLLWSVSSGN